MRNLMITLIFFNCCLLTVFGQASTTMNFDILFKLETTKNIEFYLMTSGEWMKSNMRYMVRK